MNNLIRNGDFFEWPNGTSITITPGNPLIPISGDLSFVRTGGAPLPTITVSRQQHPVISSIRQGFPTYFLRVTPSFAIVLGPNDRSYLSWSFVESLDRHVAQGAYAHFSFWAKASVDREIVVRFNRTFGTGGANNNGHTSEVLVTKSVQLTKGWKKYQVDCRFPAFSATYGAGATVEARIYLQGGSAELGDQVLPGWVNAPVDFSQVAMTLTQVGEEYETERISSGVSAAVTTIYATDPAYGAVGNYSGTQNTAGSGTDNRAAIQAALDAAYTQGPGGVNDTVNGTYNRVVIPRGRYYIAAPADGSPSLVVPLKCELDFSEAELHFGIPALVGGAPPFGWCAIKIGQQAALTIGHMQVVASTDQTYGGAWFGNTLDAVRIQESDGSTYVRGGGRERLILGFTRGAAIRPIACWNTWIENLQFASCAFGVVGSYFGSGFASYTRYRDGGVEGNNVCTSCYIRACSFLNIFKSAIIFGVKGDANAPAAGIFQGLETFDGAHNGAKAGPLSIIQCAFEQIGECVLYSLGTQSVEVSDCGIESAGYAGGGSGVFTFALSRMVSLNKINWIQAGNSYFVGSYTGPLTSQAPNPLVFVYVNVTDVAPSLNDIEINNSQTSSCKLVDSAGASRRPIIKNLHTETAAQMQGTSTYMPVAPPNRGGNIWSVSTTGLGPDATYTPDGARVVFKFSNGFTAEKPQWIVADGIRKTELNADGTTNWTYNSGTGETTMTVAPTKDIRAFF